MNKSLPPHSSRASGDIINHVFIMSPLQGFRMVGGTLSGGSAALHRRLFIMPPLARLEITNSPCYQIGTPVEKISQKNLFLQMVFLEVP
jgi:hypothetical protein